MSRRKRFLTDRFLIQPFTFQVFHSVYLEAELLSAAALVYLAAVFQGFLLSDVEADSGLLT